MPADVRCLAQEAIELAGKATPGPWHHAWDTDWKGRQRLVIGRDGCPAAAYTPPADTKYNRRDDPYGEWIDPRADSNARYIAHAGTHYATIAKALIEVMDDRDALLADLPHALGRCGCIHFEETRDGNSIVISGGWTKEHHVALDRLEERLL